MGQRLVITCIRDGERFATLYFHWSAFTFAAFSEGDAIISHLKDYGYSKDKTKEETILILERILRDRHSDGYHPTWHGGVNRDPEEVAAFEKLGLSKEEMDIPNLYSDCGIISITKDGMRESEEISEGIAVLDFDNETFENCLFYEIEPNSEALQICGVQYDDVPEWKPPVEVTGAIKWENLRETMCWFYCTYGFGSYILGKLNNGNLLTSVC